MYLTLNNFKTVCTMSIRTLVNKKGENNMENDLTIRKLQECIKNIDNKNNSNDKYMLKLMEEVGELAEVIRKNKRMEKGEYIKGTIEEELQDVLYYIVCLANVNDIDLQECVYLKEKLNCEKYSRKNMFED